MVVLGASVASRLLRRCSSAGSWAQGVGPGRARLDVARYYCATPPPPPRSAHEVEAHIRQLLHERVSPHVRADGGDVHFEGFEAESGVLRVSLSGACVGCPSSTLTMRFMIKNLVMHYVPEVRNVVRVGQEEDDED